MESSDMDLLRDYARDNSEQAFRMLVERHINMVHAVALRQTGNAQVAEDVTQAVFIVLAEKAATLSHSTILTGWLFRATRFAAANVKRAEARREHWEQKAAQMDPSPPTPTPPDSPADSIAPLLNAAIEELPERDRLALLLRFFDNKSMEEVGRSLGTTASAAKMRLSRALEKLRLSFRKRGVVVSTAVLATFLSAQSAQAAPVGLASSVATLAFLKQTTTSTLPIVKGTLLLMAQTKSKSLAIAAVVLLLAGGGAVVVQQALTQKTAPASPRQNASQTTPAKPTSPATNSFAGKILVFRDSPSWNRKQDFEDALTAMGVNHEVKPATEMNKTDLRAYPVVIIPGAQWNTDYYQRYADQAERFESYVTNGGTLVFELNGAENSGIPLPGGVAMIKHGSKENAILLPAHPALSPFGGKPIRASYASHGYLEGVPTDALRLAAETVDGLADTNKPTFVEYRFGAGRVIAACQCFHDQDGSGRGALMEPLINYAAEKRWFAENR